MTAFVKSGSLVLLLGTIMTSGAHGHQIGQLNFAHLNFGSAATHTVYQGSMDAGSTYLAQLSIDQTSEPALTEDDKSSQPPVSETPKVDETALRYFARQGDTARLNAEIARLQALYPAWTPPADPLVLPDVRDEQLDTMWKLYSEGKYSEVRSAIATRKKSDPAWKVPEDLEGRLKLADIRQKLVSASDLRQFDVVVAAAAADPALLTCADVDVLWRLAEAFAETKKPDRASDVYTYVLKTCTDPKERLATVQKASLLLEVDAIERLLAFAKPSKEGVDEFQSVRDDLVRKTVGSAIADHKAVVASKDIATMEQLADASKSASDANLLGWYFIGQKSYEKSADWFSRAQKIDDNVDIAQGLGLSLIALDKPSDAEAILYPWYSKNENARAVYLAAVANLLAISPAPELSPDVLARMVPVIVEAKNVPSAQQMGWYARSFNQPRAAADWFRIALKWNVNDEPSAYGLAITLQQLKDRRGVAQIQRTWKARSQRIAELGERKKRSTIPDPKIDPSAIDTILTSDTGKPSGSTNSGLREQLDVLIETSRPQEVPHLLLAQSNNSGCGATDRTPRAARSALQRGWCLMELNRPVEAVKAFEIALGSSDNQVRSDAAFGQALAYLRNGLTDEAALAAAKAPQTKERSVDLEAAILSQRATAFFEAGRYSETLLTLDQRSRIAADRTDLMVLRGYAYLKLGKKGEARRMFEAVAAAGDREGVKGLAALVEESNSR